MFGEMKGKMYSSGQDKDEEGVEISEIGNGVVQLETTEWNRTQIGAIGDPNRDIKPKRRQKRVKVRKREGTEWKRHVDNMNVMDRLQEEMKKRMTW